MASARWWLLLSVVILVWPKPCSAAEPSFVIDAELRARLVDASQADDAFFASLRATDTNAIVLRVGEDSFTSRREIARVVQQVQQERLRLFYWIEVARCPELADARPELMASLQGHPEWRRFFPKCPLPAVDEVVKTYPWVPVLSREGFDAQLTRVQKLLDGLPRPVGVFLNDLQAAPSACGCGHLLCRWTTDYGPKRTTKSLGPDAAAQFVDEVAASYPPLPKEGPGRVGRVQVIPVWTTECEAHDEHELCAGVGCFEGLCWKEFSKQLSPLAERPEPLALLLPFRAFGRDLPHYGDRAGWITEAIDLMRTQPERHSGKPVSPSRFIAVLQGWDVTRREIMAQIAQTRRAGAAGFVVSYVPIEQSWEPRIVKWK